MDYKILQYVSIFLALLVVLPLHELSHAFVAIKCGDMTPKLNNRYTLNPFAHIDIIGLLCFTFIGFGWSKPMPINPYNFRKPKRDEFLVSIAGPVGNILLAFIVYSFFLLSLLLPQFGYFTYVLSNTLINIVNFSLVFAIFNILPIYPLDGFIAYAAISKVRGNVYYFLRNKGIYILYFLFALSIFADITGLWYFDILGIAINFIKYYLQFPIYTFWGLIFYGRV